MQLNFSRSVRSFSLTTFIRSSSSVVGGAAAVDSSASPKPFSEMPSPKGSVPLLGHYFRIRNGFSEETKRMFEEVNGPIFKLKVPGM